jgi:GMP synthase (glutamine-hydrolysing)
MTSSTPRSPATRTRIVVLRTGSPIESVAAASGTFAQIFERGLRGGPEHGGGDLELDELDITNRGDNDPLPDTSGWHGVVMTGSGAYVGDDAAWMRWGARLLRHLVEVDVPYLGVCFGHQLLGRAMGADVGENPRGREMGTIDVEVTSDVVDDPLFSRLPRSFRAQVTHRDVVRAPGDRLRVLARAPHDPHHAVQAGRRQWGVQFHPEFDDATIRLYLRARAELLDTAHGEGSARRRLDGARPSPEAARLLPLFADVARKEAASRVHPPR